MVWQLNSSPNVKNLLIFIKLIHLYVNNSLHTPFVFNRSPPFFIRIDIQEGCGVFRNH